VTPAPSTMASGASARVARAASGEPRLSIRIASPMRARPAVALDGHSRSNTGE
jgi:hypothetical protein